MDREAWQATVHGIARVRYNLPTREQSVQLSSVQLLSRVQLFVTP